LEPVKSSPENAGKKQITRIAGATGSSQHSIDEEELEQFVLHINQVLRDDSDIGNRASIDPKTHQLFQECQDGLVLSKLINDSAPETIDERVLNMGAKLNPFQMTENNNLVINSAKAIGCSVVNIGSQDLIEGREHLVLGLVWQIIKVGLLGKVNLQLHPELYRLLAPGEALEDLLKLPADELLLRWFNYHLCQAGWHRKVTNFSSDIKDSENYTVLLNQLCPEECSRSALNESDLGKRAELVLSNAGKIGCRKYVSVKAITNGNPKLNLAFVANLFNMHPGLAPLTEEELGSLDEGLFASKGDREARAFALWMNSMGVDPFVNSIYDDLRDGRVLLQVFDRVSPGCVVWRRVNQKVPLIRFKCIENTNYVVELGKHWNFSLVGIQGADITDGSKTLTLALVWQLMRTHIIETLKKLSSAEQAITDADIINWANALVEESGKETRMSSFKDASLHSGHFLIDLLNAMKKGVVNYELVTLGETDEDAKMNAKYAISIARKLGATIFLLPEDIIEVKPKMILTFVGTLMAIHQSHK
jgi:plastin-1